MRNSDANPVRLVDELRETVHEINNALTPIMANAQLARLMVGGDSKEIEEILDDVVAAASRANHLILSMRGITQSLQEALPAENEPGDALKEGSRGHSSGY